MFVYGDSFKSYCVGIIVPNKDDFLEIAKSMKIEGTFEELCKNKNMKQFLLNSIDKHCRKEGIFGFEIPKNIYLESISMVDHGCYTNTFKL